MNSYMIERNGGARFLGTDRHLDYYITKGFSIYEIDSDGHKKLIATPEKGFLGETASAEIHGEVLQDNALSLETESNP